MRLDYNEKKGRESVERKPLQKNRPRKEPMGIFALLSVVALLVSFGGGVVTGWFFFKGSGSAPAAVAQAPRKEEPLPVPAQPVGPDAPLTFYKTLSAGGKGVIGSGLNLEKTHPAAAVPHPAPAAAPAPADVARAAQEKQDVSASFVVQIASYRDRREADQARAKLTDKGMAAYVLESKLPENGVWYRLRVGRHLTRAEAAQLAEKAGKGAVVLPE